MITDANGGIVSRISKELFHMTDHYVIDVATQEDALHALMVVLVRNGFLQDKMFAIKF